MRALLPALVIGTMIATASACVEGLDSESGRPSSSTGPERGDASGRSASRPVRFTPIAAKPSDSLAFEARADAGLSSTVSENQDDAGPDTDAGADSQTSEFERAIVYDCTETLQCMGPANNIPACVVSVRRALNAASPPQRRAFMESVARCRPRQACGYVACASGKAP